jgi:5-methylcytosine-specific restriction endonuclease McrA
LKDLCESVGRGDLDYGRSPVWLQHLWRALLLNSARYRCAYCGRDALSTHHELGATLRFELDHVRARSRLKNPNDFALGNTAVACRSCNVIKGQMPPAQFKKELKSLAAAVHRPR